ncbi:CGNR zinc finger domain-containing protein [Sphingobacterium pedocola]|uniref:Zinc finger CGNR domain-containing protein n=1 Tax=Sphingobacterium pedocola TaxID=2082722 RepID=A0ABR9TAZ7_9SPHI|nr:CGNR zinc finger domain-containing protein [Sphingobacterium pedocola]MBE8722504.1 hypothetical protein [Sphingobacterium pedocola]
MGKTRSINSLNIDSTVLCCNFVNTQSSWTSADRYDYFQTYDDFIEWCLKVNISSREQLQGLREFAAEQWEDAEAALNRIKEIRSILHGLISAVAKNSEEELLHFLPTFNLLLRVDAVSRQRLVYRDKKFTIDQINISGDLTAPVWLAVESLATLLAESDLARIKECPKCGWVFLDETKNGKRKWCNPKYCGTSDKMKRYNDRKKNTTE